MTRSPRYLLASAAVASLLLGAAAACSDDDSQQAEPDPSAASGETAESTQPAELLPPAEFAVLLEAQPDVPLINVHIPYEGHIDGTDHHVDYRDLASWDGLPEDLDDPIVIYCRSGRMSGIASEELAALGYTNITDLEGGFVAWQDAGFDLLQD